LTDQEVIILALKDAARIIAEHLAPGRTRDPEETLTRLIGTLDRPEITRAIERLEAGARAATNEIRGCSASEKNS
jgi:hypothetical protein